MSPRSSAVNGVAGTSASRGRCRAEPPEGVALRQLWNQAVAVQQLACLDEAEIDWRHDQVGGRELGVVELLAGLAHELVQSPQRQSERYLVAGHDGALGVAIELVDRGANAVGDLPLTFAHQADDHEPDPTSCAGGPLRPSSAFSLASSSSTCPPCCTCAS